MNNQELKVKIRSLISKNELQTAIDDLLSFYANSKKLDEIIIQSARYEGLKSENIKGTANKEELNKELNSLRNNILSFIRDNNFLEEKTQLIQKEKENITKSRKLNLDKEVKIQSIREFETNIAISITKIAIIEVLMSNYEKKIGCSISLIAKESKLKIRRLVVEFLRELDEHGLVEKRKGRKTLWILNENGYMFFKNLNSKIKNR